MFFISKFGKFNAQLLFNGITYRVECENGFDTRKNLFFAMAEKGYAVVGLEEEGMSLEDVFIKLTDTNPSAGTRKGGGAK